MGTGLRWVRMDLHVHTWASACFRREGGATERSVAAAIVEHCVDSDIAAIAVTDHNTAAGIHLVDEAARGTGLTVFPGVEISVPAGKKGLFHIIGIFAPEFGHLAIEALLQKLDMEGEPGSETSYCDKTPRVTIETIADKGGLAVLPHPDSNQGICGGARGKFRDDVLQSRALKAAEYAEKSREYLEHLATYRASDGGATDANGKHTVDAIGKGCSLFKVEEVSFEALRQCFADPRTRIRVDGELPRTAYPRIERIEVAGGFLDGLTVEFHEGLNAIIGGKGVGKSLVVEFLRFGLCQEPTHAQAALRPVREDHQRKLERRLGLGGMVIVDFRDRLGDRYRVTRTYDGDSNPVETVNVETSESISTSPAALLPLVAFSQREVILTVEDDASRTAWLDNLCAVDAPGPTAELLSRFRQSDTQLAAALRAREGLEEDESRIKQLGERLESIRQATDSPVVRAMAWANKKRAMIDDAIRYHENVIDALRAAIAGLDSYAWPTVPADDSTEAANDDAIRRCVELCERTSGEYGRVLAELSAQVQNSLGEVRAIRGEYEAEYVTAQQAHAAEMRELQIDDANLRAEQVKLEKQLAEETRAVADRRKASERLPTLQAERRALLGEWHRADEAVSAAREERFAALTKSSGLGLKVEVRRGANMETYLQALVDARTGCRGDALQAVVDRVGVSRLVSLVIEQDSVALGDLAQITHGQAERLVLGLAGDDRVAIEKLLSWEYTHVPRDVAMVLYRAGTGGEFRAIHALSVGQKCSALTILALADGTDPVVIDQPEDSLDIRGVWDDIVGPVRDAKEARQFVFTTHNSTLAVAGDADNYVVLVADEDGGHLSTAGALELPSVRPEIVRHLEGGPEPYKLKRAKYGNDVE